MSQSLTINGKEYIQSNVLSSRVGYSSDYIGKLAREEKILGTQIGRQWFVEEQSLVTFLAQTKIEKEIRKEDLRLQRKAEHLKHQKKNDKTVLRNLHVVALAQTFIILACGAFAGGLGYVVAAEDLAATDLKTGVEVSVAYIQKSVFSADSFADVVANPRNFLAASTEGVDTTALHFVEEESLTFTNLPQFPQRESLEHETAGGEVEDMLGQFSDEVVIVSDGNGDQFIEPVFRESQEERAQRFLLVPVNNASQ